MPFIHRTSSLSLFYDINLTEYNNILRGCTNKLGTISISKSIPSGITLQIPIAHDFVLEYSIGTPLIETYPTLEVISYGSSVVGLAGCDMIKSYKFLPKKNPRHSRWLSAILTSFRLCTQDEAYCLSYLDRSYS